MVARSALKFEEAVQSKQTLARMRTFCPRHGWIPHDRSQSIVILFFRDGPKLWVGGIKIV